MKHDDLSLWAAYTKDVRPLPRKAVETSPPPPRPSLLPRAEGYLDLHGLTVHQAWETVRDYVLGAALDGHKRTVVVTGFSGAIRREFPRWIENLPRIREATPMRGDGAFLLRLRTRR